MIVHPIYGRKSSAWDWGSRCYESIHAWSKNGMTNWKFSEEYAFSIYVNVTNNGVYSIQKYDKLERPFIYIDSNGTLVGLFTSSLLREDKEVPKTMFRFLQNTQQPTVYPTSFPTKPTYASVYPTSYPTSAYPTSFPTKPTYAPVYPTSFPT